MVLWSGKGWNDANPAPVTKSNGGEAFGVCDCRNPYGPACRIHDRPTLAQVVGRAGVEVIRPKGRVILDRALAFVGMVTLAALCAGGLFFWAGVIQAWMR